MALILRSKSHIFGLSAELAEIVNNLNTEVTARSTAVTVLEDRITGEVDTLNTAISTLDGNALKKSANLLDLNDVAAARSNLGVDSSAEVDNKITAAKLSLGTRHVVADIAARDALVGLDLADSVFVTDDGDGHWTVYQPVTVDAAGAGTTWIVLADQDTYLNANSAAAIKASYESNPDTNAFTDAEKAKVALLSATQAIDLDKVIQSDELITDVTLANATDAQIASAAAVKAFVQAATNAGGAVFKSESVTVVGDKITLSYKPKDGMILNFGTVRHIDATGVAFDIPVMVDGSDASGMTYILSADSVGQFDAKNVSVQYPYTL